MIGYLADFPLRADIPVANASAMTQWLTLNKDRILSDCEMLTFRDVDPGEADLLFAEFSNCIDEWIAGLKASSVEGDERLSHDQPTKQDHPVAFCLYQRSKLLHNYDPQQPYGEILDAYTRGVLILAGLNVSKTKGNREAAARFLDWHPIPDLKIRQSIEDTLIEPFKSGNWTSAWRQVGTLIAEIDARIENEPRNNVLNERRLRLLDLRKLPAKLRGSVRVDFTPHSQESAFKPPHDPDHPDQTSDEVNSTDGVDEPGDIAGPDHVDDNAGQGDPDPPEKGRKYPTNRERRRAQYQKIDGSINAAGSWLRFRRVWADNYHDRLTPQECLSATTMLKRHLAAQTEHVAVASAIMLCSGLFGRPIHDLLMAALPAECRDRPCPRGNEHWSECQFTQDQDGRWFLAVRPPYEKPATGGSEADATDQGDSNPSDLNSPLSDDNRTMLVDELRLQLPKELIPAIAGFVSRMEGLKRPAAAKPYLQRVKRAIYLQTFKLRHRYAVPRFTESRFRAVVVKKMLLQTRDLPLSQLIFGEHFQASPAALNYICLLHNFLEARWIDAARPVFGDLLTIEDAIASDSWVGSAKAYDILMSIPNLGELLELDQSTMTFRPGTDDWAVGDTRKRADNLGLLLIVGTLHRNTDTITDVRGQDISEAYGLVSLSDKTTTPVQYRRIAAVPDLFLLSLRRYRERLTWLLKRYRADPLMNPDCFRQIQSALRGNGPLLLHLSMRGGRIVAEPWRGIKLWKRLLEKDLKHDSCRHLFSSYMRLAGFPAPYIEQQMGHLSGLSLVDDHGSLAPAAYRDEMEPLFDKFLETLGFRKPGGRQTKLDHSIDYLPPLDELQAIQKAELARDLPRFQQHCGVTPNKRRPPTFNKLVETAMKSIDAGWGEKSVTPDLTVSKDAIIKAIALVKAGANGDIDLAQSALSEVKRQLRMMTPKSKANWTVGWPLTQTWIIGKPSQVTAASMIAADLVKTLQDHVWAAPVPATENQSDKAALDQQFQLQSRSLVRLLLSAGFKDLDQFLDVIVNLPDAQWFRGADGLFVPITVTVADDDDNVLIKREESFVLRETALLAAIPLLQAIRSETLHPNISAVLDLENAEAIKHSRAFRSVQIHSQIHLPRQYWPKDNRTIFESIIRAVHLARRLTLQGILAAATDGRLVHAQAPPERLAALILNDVACVSEDAMAPPETTTRTTVIQSGAAETARKEIGQILSGPKAEAQRLGIILESHPREDPNKPYRDLIERKLERGDFKQAAGLIAEGMVQLMQPNANLKSGRSQGLRYLKTELSYLRPLAAALDALEDAYDDPEAVSEHLEGELSHHPETMRKQAALIRRVYAGAGHTMGLDPPSLSFLPNGTHTAAGLTNVVLSKREMEIVRDLLWLRATDCSDDDAQKEKPNPLRIGASEVEACLLFELHCRFGLRRSESLGLEPTNLTPSGNDEIIAILTNKHRGVKSKASERSLLLEDVQGTTWSAFLTERRRLEPPRGLIFGAIDTTEGAHELILLRDMMRHVTGDPAACLHSLRHAFASNGHLEIYTGNLSAIERAIAIETLTANLGHSSPAVTVQYYGHAMQYIASKCLRDGFEVPVGEASMLLGRSREATYKIVQRSNDQDRWTTPTLKAMADWKTERQNKESSFRKSALNAFQYAPNRPDITIRFLIDVTRIGLWESMDLNHVRRSHAEQIFRSVLAAESAMKWQPWHETAFRDMVLSLARANRIAGLGQRKNLIRSALAKVREDVPDQWSDSQLQALHEVGTVVPLVDLTPHPILMNSVFDGSPEQLEDKINSLGIQIICTQVVRKFGNEVSENVTTFSVGSKKASHQVHGTTRFLLFILYVSNLVNKS